MPVLVSHGLLAEENGKVVLSLLTSCSFNLFVWSARPVAFIVQPTGSVFVDLGQCLYKFTSSQCFAILLVRSLTPNARAINTPGTNGEL